MPQSRPPRVKRFSARRLLKWLSGTDSQKTSSKLQQQKSTSSSSAATTAHPSVQYSTASDRQASLQPPRRATSYPSTSPPESRRPSSLIDDVTTTSSIPGMLVVNKRASLSHKFRERDAAPGAGVGEGGGGGHKRRYSGGNIPMSQIEGFGQPTSHTPIPLFTAGGLGSHIRPFTEGMQKMIDRDVSPGVRIRSLSHPRSPSPNPLPLGGKSFYLSAA